MSKLIFRPLGMTSAGFGAHGAPGRLDQPWQYRVVFGLRMPVGPGPRSEPAIKLRHLATDGEIDTFSRRKSGPKTRGGTRISQPVQ